MLKCNYLIKSPVKGHLYDLRAKITYLQLPMKSMMLIFFLLLFIPGQVKSATLDLREELNNATGNSVTLDSANTYVLDDGEYWFDKDMTIYGNGATIQLDYAIKAYDPGITLTIDHCIISGEGPDAWGALCGQPGTTIVVQNDTTISCSGDADRPTGIHISDASLTVQSSSISSCYTGVNIIEATSGSTAQLHGVTISDSRYAVQVVGAQSSVTIDQGSALSYVVSDPGIPDEERGTGVGVLQGASAIVHDTTLTGFLNAVDIQPSDPGGTAEVVNCYFLNNYCSALNAIHARDVLLSGCRVEGALQDGLYLVESTAVVEKSQVIGSLNTGVTFYGCSNSTIRNCLIKDSAHQGLTIDDNPATGVPSNVQVLNNTFVNNNTTNLWIVADSTAQTQGNIFALAPEPNSSVHLEGPQGVALHSSLFIGSYYGMDIKKNSNPTVVLSSFTENDTQGILVYESSSLTLHNSSFWSNGSSSWSVFVNEGATVAARYCSFGPAGDQAFYNNAGTTCDVANNYWASTGGPQVDGAGSGAVLAWNRDNGSNVTYDPFLDQAPVESNVNSSLSLPSGGSLTWDSTLGVTLGLNANTGITALSEEIAGVLRVNDTDHLSSVTPPAGLLSGQLYVVWVSAALRMNSSSGYLKFNLPLGVFEPELLRREIDGSWTQVAGIWDPVSNVLTYSPTDMHLLNGTFAVTDVIPVLYVEPYGYCDGNQPCFSDIQDAVDYASTAVSDIWIGEGTYIGNIFVEGFQELTFQPGWNQSFTDISSNSEVNGKLTIKGTATLPGGPLVLQ